jgi:hypothetical protein
LEASAVWRIQPHWSSGVIQPIYFEGVWSESTHPKIHRTLMITFIGGGIQDELIAVIIQIK